MPTHISSPKRLDAAKQLLKSLGGEFKALAFMPVVRVRGQLFGALVDHADGLAGVFVC